jgi:uncharacterized repeat protein (TIGR03803 family)
MKRLSSACLSLAGYTLAVLLGLSYVPSVRAQGSPSTIKTLFAFSCDSTTKVCPQGQDPSSLIQSADGNFYGTTEFGGTGNQAAGTVFKLTPSGHLTTIYTFVAGENGANPTSLVEGNDGFLYGTTGGGGANNQGVVFKLSKVGTIHVLHSFCSLANCDDGNQPFNLVLGKDGNFYGCTTYSFPGTLFRITPGGSYTLLHTFSAAVDGPQCIGMTLASDGNIYGDTVGGVSFPTVLFRLTPAGQVTVVHAWRYPQFPVSPLTQASDGDVWGVLSHISDVSEAGMFDVGLSGAGYREIQLPYPFNPPHVQFMTEASDGNFWGTLGDSIVSFTLGGKSLQQISIGKTNDSGPALLIQASNGTLLGLTNEGAFQTQDPGEIFTIEPGLAAPKPLFLSFVPSAGAVGSQVIIHGTHFVGTTAVAFNGMSAKFQVLNTGNIRATVPVGATTGQIAVINKGGEAISTKSYTVQ